MKTRKQFTEAEIKSVGGLSPDERGLRGIDELMEAATQAVPKFSTVLKEGRGLSQWWKAAKGTAQRLREANSETALGFLLRKGVQNEANNWYMTTPTTWRSVCLVKGSSAVAEWYAPLYPSTIAGPVDRGGRFPETRIIGENSVLRNLKFGQIVDIERELFDDDQTGQIADRAKWLGAAMAILEEIWWSFTFLGTARTYANVTVPASGYATTDTNGNAITTPFSTSIYGSTGNEPNTFGPLNVGRLKAALTQLLNAVDPLSNKLVVNPTRLLHSNQDFINAKLILSPGPYPGIPGQSNTTVANNPVAGGTSATAGTSQGVFAGYPGGAFQNNPFAGLGIEDVLLRYWPDWAWAIGEGGKGIVFQERDPVEVIQEAPNSGSYFNFDSIRWRSRRRMASDWVGGGSRFFFLGNDGSVAGQQ